MPLITRNEAEILRRLKQRLSDEGYTNVEEVGSPTNAIAKATAPEIAGLYKALTYLHKSVDVTQNTGRDLDRYGRMFGLTRGETSAAQDTSDHNVKFYIDPNANKTAATLAAEYNLANIRIPKGTVLSGTNARYKTTSEVTLAGNNTEVFVQVIALGNGDTYNVQAGELNKHNLSSYPALSKLAAFVRCTNLLPITSGQNSETDNEFRQRLQNANSIAASANTLAIQSVARSVPGVSDVSIIPYVYGSGTSAVFVESTSPVISPGLINAVQDAVDNVKADGSRVYVRYPDYKAIKLKIEIVLRPGVDENAYGNTVKPLVVDYINNLPRGTSFDVNNLLPIVSNDGQALHATPTNVQVGDYNIYTRKIQNLRTFLATKQALSQYESWYTNSSLIDLCIVE